MKILKVNFHPGILLLINCNLLAVAAELTPLPPVTVTTSQTEYGSESGSFPELEFLQAQHHKRTTTKRPKTTTASDYETDSSSSISTTESRTTTTMTTEPEKRPPQVIFEQEIDPSLDTLSNYFSETKDTIELEYKTEINPVTLKEQRIILANFSEAEQDYGCYILTCAAQYPVKWVTDIPMKDPGSTSQANQECRFGDQWIYSMWNREKGKRYDDTSDNQIDMDGSYKIRLAFKMTKGRSGRIKCQSMTNQSLFTDYYVYTNAGPRFVIYDGNVYKSFQEAFWEVPPVVGAVLFKPNGNIYDNINEFFENKTYLQPQFSVLNNSVMIIPCPSNYRDTSFQPTLLQKGARGDPLVFFENCTVPFNYTYEPSIGFIFDDLNFVKTYFLQNCSSTQFLLKKIEFSCYDGSSGGSVDINVYVTGNRTEKLEFTRTFLDMFPANAEKGVDYNYLLENGDGIEDHHFQILPCYFPTECEILKSSLDTTVQQYDNGSNRCSYDIGNSTNNLLVSGLIRSFKYNGMLPRYDFFFPGLDVKEDGFPRRYLLSEDIPKKSVITLKHILPASSTVGLSETKQFRCEISNFVLINNIKMYKSRKISKTNDEGEIELIETLELLNQRLTVNTTDYVEEGWYSWDDLTQMEGFNPNNGSTYLDIFVNITEGDSAIICTAPWQNSTQLLNETIDIRPPKINKTQTFESFNNDNGTFTMSIKTGEAIPSIVCSASGGPGLSISWIPPPPRTYCGWQCFLNETKSTIGESTLEFIGLHAYNYMYEGIYTCEVINDYGRDTVTVNVITAKLEQEKTDAIEDIRRMFWILITYLLVLIIIPIVTFVVRKYRYLKNIAKKFKQTEQRDITEEEIQEFLHGQPQSQSSSSGSGFYSLSENDTENHISCYNSNVDVSELPLDPQFIIPEAALTIEKTAKLGEGHFGIVYRGRVNAEAVAVKSTKEDADVSCVKAFLEEIKIMAYVAQKRRGAKQGSENIVNFIGVVIDRLRERLVYAVVELSPIGNLHSYLETIRERRAPAYNNLLVNDQFITYVSAGLQTPFAFTQCQPNIITTMDLVHWCGQIAAGMNYLVSKRVIHGDLATRNVLVFPHNVVKITDFGLSKKLYAYSQYVRDQDKKVALPWAWMALECLQHHTFSTESDIWSFGVTMWEIFSMGQFPYPGYNFSDDFVSALSSGMRMGKPTYASSTIYNQMWNCWNSSSKNRPSFSQLQDYFNDIVQDWIADADVGQVEPNKAIHAKNDIAVYIHKNYV